MVIKLFVSFLLVNRENEGGIFRERVGRLLFARDLPLLCIEAYVTYKCRGSTYTRAVINSLGRRKIIPVAARSCAQMIAPNLFLPSRITIILKYCTRHKPVNPETNHSHHPHSSLVDALFILRNLVHLFYRKYQYTRVSWEIRIFRKYDGHLGSHLGLISKVISLMHIQRCN